MSDKFRFYDQPRSITEPRWKSYIVETTTTVFTPEQCNKIIETGRSQPKTIGTVNFSDNVRDEKTRLSHVSWIPFGMLEPMYRQLETVMH